MATPQVNGAWCFVKCGGRQISYLYLAGKTFVLSTR